MFRRKFRFHFGKRLEKWNLGSKSNVSRIRSALIEKELIDKQGGKLYVSDPVLRFWLTRYLQRM